MRKYQRILIIGSAGSGKTVISNLLSEKLHINATHLDKVYWNSNWEKKSIDECTKLTKELIKEDQWILDGNYIQTLDLRLQRADLVIFLKINRFKSLSSIFKRNKLTKCNKIVRDDLPVGCEDDLNFSFLKWAFNFNNQYAPKLMEVINKYPNVEVKTFSKRQEAINFIEGLTNNEGE